MRRIDTRTGELIKVGGVAVAVVQISRRRVVLLAADQESDEEVVRAATRMRRRIDHADQKEYDPD